MADHATLAASAAHRWLACPPSALLEASMPDSESEYAAEGTHAHEWAAMWLHHYLDKIPRTRKAAEAGELRKSPYHSAELEEAVDVYVKAVKAKIRKAGDGAVTLIEERVDYSDWVPGGYGTADCIIIQDGVLDVNDYKHGKGVRVGAEGNPQMRLYALGALAAYDMLYDIHTVCMTIHQPRLNNISTEELTVADLLDWAEGYVRPRAELADKGEGEYFSGEHCRFCRARAVCRAHAEQATEIAKEDFAGASPDMLTSEEIARVLDAAPDLMSWLKSVQDYALAEAMSGTAYPGYKVVAGRSVRRYSDPDKVAEALRAQGYDDAVIYERSLLSLTALERALGKARVQEALDGLITKPQGKPALVPVTDPRPEYQANLADDFKED